METGYHAGRGYRPVSLWEWLTSADQRQRRRRRRFAVKHEREHPDHQVWWDLNLGPRGGASCFTCDIWIP